jgi:hypothetical protein
MEEKKIVAYFSGLSATIKSVKEVQKLYNPQLAFNFNSFKFLQPGENKYSEIIAFFLNPSETHGQADLFLKLFLKKVGLDDKISTTDFVDIMCKCEHGIDNQRRIDILIVFGHNKFAIAIENKVWAKDQKHQLRDYNEHLKKEFLENYCLLYLTPYQKEPTEESIETDLFKKLENAGLFKLIGYTDHIIDCVHDWALHCQAERVRIFLLDFEQYLKKEFLGQTFMEENQTIANYALKNSENLEVAFATSNALIEIKQRLLDQFKIQIKEIADANNLISLISPKLGLNDLYTSFSFYKETWEYANISFQFTSRNANDFKYGICSMGDDAGDNPVIIPETLINSISKKFNKSKEKNDWWLFSEYFDSDYRNWSNQSKPWIDIQNGEIKKRIDSIVKDFIGKINDVQL